MEENEMDGNDNQAGNMLGQVMDDDSLSNSTSEGDSMDFEINEEDMKNIMRLESSLEENPNQYDVHLEYVALLRTCRMQERLKDARRSMHETFPMQEDMWLEWIHDEIENADDAEDLNRIAELFDACHKDYLSVTLWVEHIGFVEQCEKQGEDGAQGMQTVRGVIDEALEACGLHATQGHMVWNAAIDFEMGLKEDLKDSERVDKMFLEYLETPFPQDVSDAARDRYLGWLEEQGKRSGDEPISKSLIKKMERAQRAFEMRQQFEAALDEARELEQGPGNLLLAAYEAYIELERSGEDARRAIIMFERAIVEFPVADKLWREYLHFAGCLEDLDISDVYERALRNCPWVGEIWASYIHYVERKRVGLKDLLTQIDGIYQRGLLYLQHIPLELQHATLAFVDALRHQGGQNITRIRSVFQEAREYMKRSSTFDPEQRLTSYWAKCEAVLGTSDSEAQSVNLQAGMSVWENVLDESCIDSLYSSTWLYYINFLARFGASIESRRNIFQRALSKSSRGAEELLLIAQQWVRLEQEEGTCDSYFQAFNHCHPIFKQAENSAFQAMLAYEQSQMESKNAQKARQKNDPNFKRKSDERNDDRPTKKAKREKIRKDNASSNTLIVFVKHLAPNITEQDLLNEFMERDCGNELDVTIGRDPKTNRSKGYAYVRCNKIETRDKLCALNGKTLQGKQLFIAPSNPPKGKKKDAAVKDKGGDRKSRSKHDYKQARSETYQKPRIDTSALLVPRSAVLTGKKSSSKPVK
eukprot:jgi/Picsp_1/1018/NSC_04502-R1_squamous cell carcinoma antigen recognized by t-cells 3-like